ncbi:MAG: serine/threonine protein kinase [Verrucomicrobiales bacterium]|nr:serine/threonine protein kinase [Verrucomicrobiales bacterium]
MSHPMLARLGITEIAVVFLIVLLVAAAIIALVVFAVWLTHRLADGRSDPRGVPSGRTSPGLRRKLSFVTVEDGRVRVCWPAYFLGLGLLIPVLALLNGLLLAAGVWSGMDTVLVGLLVAVLAFNVQVIYQFNRASRTASSPSLPPAGPASPPPPVPASASGAGVVCSRCHAPLPGNAPEGLCPQCLMRVGLATQTGTVDDSAPVRSSVAPPSVAEVARRFPHLEILECLGHGGMGVVFKARQPKLDRLVALKVLLPERAGDPRFAERFTREARALARLNHPNIVAIHDSGEADGMFYLLMEYVEGSTLRQALRAGRLAPETALALVPAICEALEFAHQQGVVHRDIKPENVLLTPQGRVKLADFGIAKLVHPEPATPALTEDRSVVGTPHYMAPEQIEHPQRVDHRADIYSLGVVFYEMLTGELPLGKFPPPSRQVRVDVRVDEVVLHALEKEPSRRYQHVSEVRTDVQDIRRSSPTLRGETPPPGGPPPFAGATATV